MRIVVNKHLCVGAGRCAELAPRTFAVSDADGLVVVLNERAHADEDWAVEDAVNACPSMAIRLEQGN